MKGRDPGKEGLDKARTENERIGTEFQEFETVAS
jgi:hypothetical protein